ncbi:MAG: hypothetical protein KAS72_06200 [Phycisphaerales bacterium]|nr:hypothetical protein [Phycisphaerales bacterium]
MRLSTRLILNAFANYARLGTTFLLGIFFTWYVVGKIGMIGLGTIGLVVATFGLSAAVESAIRQSLIRELAAAIATGETDRIRKSLTAAMLFCAPAAALVLFIALCFAGLAYVGFFNTEGAEHLDWALACLLVAEGIHVCFRLVASPYSQSIFASQHLGVDNFLRVIDRFMWVLSAVLVFGFWLPDEPLYVQLIGFAASRASIQMLDIFLGVILAKLLVRGLHVDFRNIDWSEFRSMMSTVWHTSQVTFLMNLNEQIIAIIINLFFGLTFNGVWQIVVQVGGQARQLTEGLVRGIEPLATNMMHQGKKQALVDLMIRTIRYQLTVSLPMVATYLIFLTPILNLWVSGRLTQAVDSQVAEGNTSMLDAFGVATVADAVTAAVYLTAVMSAIQLTAMAMRVSVRGVERILYGTGEVQSYAWFAKYASIIVIGLACLLFAFSDTPILAPIPTFIAYILFYQFVIPRAAARRTGFPIAGAWRRSLPRPLLAVVILAVPLAIARCYMPQLTLVSLFGLAAGVGILWSILAYAIILEPDERARVNHIITARLPGRRPDAA